jgi:ParB-like nuclease domain
MRLASWIKPKPAQLDLLSGVASSAAAAAAPTHDPQVPAAPPVSHGKPLMLPVTVLPEDPNNPRTEFPESELEELAEDVRQRGILQPIVVHPDDAAGRYCIHFGAKRLRAARRAGLSEVPVVVREAPADR